MKVHEYQAKELMAGAGIPVPRGGVASTPGEAREAARNLGGRVVVKAQVHAGGRGHAGGIRQASSPSEAEEAAAALLGGRLVTYQTGPHGAPVSRVLVEEAVQAEHELYLGIVIDRSSKGPVVIASDAGGMEIEEVAAQTPEKIHREGVHPLVGLRAFQARRLARAVGLPAVLVGPASQIMESLYGLFVSNDCSLAEINPLVVTADGKLLALDAKLNFEDDALFRHPELEELRDPEQEDPLEVRAAPYGISYVTLDGDVGCLVNGAGLAMATMDVIRGAGWAPANFLDVGGSASVERVAQAMSIILSDPKVKRVLVNIFGGILRCDVAAEGIVQAYRARGAQTPLVARLLGTNMAQGKEILATSGLPVTFADSLAEAAEKVGASG